MTVKFAGDWKNNGEMIADVARLHFPADPFVLDVTYGSGRWWNTYRPDNLYASDLHPKEEWVEEADFRNLPWYDSQFDVVAFDPPYKLNGRSTGAGVAASDEGYGVGEYVGWKDKMQTIHEGVVEGMRVARRGGLLLIKCQDQVCSGKMRWQTRDFADTAEKWGGRLKDSFDFYGTGGRAQPAGRRQKHAYGRPSTLLVVVKER